MCSGATSLSAAGFRSERVKVKSNGDEMMSKGVGLHCLELVPFASLSFRGPPPRQNLRTRGTANDARKKVLTLAQQSKGRL